MIFVSGGVFASRRKRWFPLKRRGLVVWDGCRKGRVEINPPIRIRLSDPAAPISRSGLIAKVHYKWTKHRFQSSSDDLCFEPELQFKALGGKSP